MTAAITASVISVAGTAYGASQMGKAGSKNRKLGRLQLEEEKRQYDQTREDWAPWREAGVRAIGELEDPNAFTASPGYNFIRDEGMRDIENRYSIKGGGGNAMKALNEYNKNLASTEWWNWRNDRRAMAGLGTTGTASTQRAGENYMAGSRGIRNDMMSMNYYDAMNRSDALNAGLSAITYGMHRYANRPTDNTMLTGVNVTPKARTTQFYEPPVYRDIW